jgi:formylmethanofuran dehydrogenase subunit E
MDTIAEYEKQAIIDDDGNECVTENSRCPNCGERRMDWLVWTPGGKTVICATCYTEYNPSKGG